MTFFDLETTGIMRDFDADKARMMQQPLHKGVTTQTGFLTRLRARLNDALDARFKEFVGDPIDPDRFKAVEAAAATILQEFLEVRVVTAQCSRTGVIRAEFQAPYWLLGIANEALDNFESHGPVCPKGDVGIDGPKGPEED